MRTEIKAGTPVFKALDAATEPMDDRRVRYVISTGSVDRDNDTIAPDGWDLAAYRKNPVVLWAHSHTDLPVGKCVSIDLEAGRLVAVCEFATHPFAETVYQMVKNGTMRATSVGFRVLEFVRNEARQGYDFKRQELLEFSVVPVPANAEALIAASAAGVDLAPLRDWIVATKAAWPGGWPEALAPRPTARQDVTAAVSPPDPLRWNRSLSKAFDIAGAEFAPQSVEQDLAAKYIEVRIAELNHGIRRVRSARMGAFLTALQEFVDADAAHIDAIRNIDQYGKEAPPQYEKVQLNSTTARDFLVDGMRFLQWGGEKLCVRVEPRWYGLEVSHYSVRRGEGAAGEAALDAVQARAAQLNFLRGEAFALSGEFLARGGESVDDLVLEDKNQAVVTRVIALVGAKGAGMEPRGMLLLGPPGTGKTLTGRILMNETKSTFIWVSSRDMAYGAFDTITDAFDMARECAPSVLFFEDVDNWIDRGTTTDLLKTELDGIKQNTGILTVLTTNYPERLPKALIDRPGRFHDVLRFDLPNEKQREAMLRKWTTGLSDAAIAEAVAETVGMSGAHVRELARFAGIIADQDGLDAAAALTAALAKLQEQRDLITAVQAGGSYYRAPAAISGKAAAGAPAVPEILRTLGTDNAAAFVKAFNESPVGKRGRVLSRANEARIRQAVAHAVTCAEHAGNCRSAMEEVLAALPQAPEPDDEPGDDTEDESEKLLEVDDAAPFGELTLEIADAAAATVREELVLELADVPDGSVDIDVKELTALLRESVVEQLGALVRETAQRTLNQMRGRMD